MKKKNNKKIKFKLGNNLALWVLIILGSFFIVQSLPNSLSSPLEVEYNDYREYLESGKIDHREILINKLMKITKNVIFELYGMNNKQPVWGDEFVKKIDCKDHSTSKELFTIVSCETCGFIFMIYFRYVNWIVVFNY